MNPDSQNLPTPEPVNVPAQIVPSETPTSPTPQNSPMVNEPPKPKNIFAPFLIVMLAILGLGAIVFWVYQNYFISSKPSAISTPSPSPVATQTLNKSESRDISFNGKQSYINEDFGISLTPPNGWHLDGANPEYILMSNYYDPKSDVGFDPGMLKIEIIQEDFSDSVDEYISNDVIHDYKSEIKKLITLDGQKAYLFTEKAYNMSSVVVKHPSRSKILHLSFLLDFGNYPTLRNQILSTFKFTEKGALNAASKLYLVKLDIKSNDNPLPIRDNPNAKYVLSEYLEVLLNLPNKSISNVVFDVRSGSPYNANNASSKREYYILLNQPAKLSPTYSDQYVTGTTEAVDDSILPYLVKNDYCEKDSDCSIRANMCSMGAYNFYQGYIDPPWGCGPASYKGIYSWFEYGMYDNELNCTVDSLKFDGSKCQKNQCTETGFKKVCGNGNYP